MRRFVDYIFTVIIKMWNTILWFFLCKRSIVLNAYIKQVGLCIRHNNFGDDLNFYLIKGLTHKHVFNYDSFYHPALKNYICIGSIVEDMTNNKSIIWGGGVMYEDYLGFVPPLAVKATRGPLTRQWISKNTPPPVKEERIMQTCIW